MPSKRRDPAEAALGGPERATPPTGGAADPGPALALASSLPTSPPVAPPASAPEHDLTRERPATSRQTGKRQRRPSRRERKAQQAAVAATTVPTGPVPIPKAGRSRRAPRRGRRVHRILRRIDLWSVFKLALVLNTCIYASVLMATAGLWAFLNSSGLVSKFESFMKDVGFNNWTFHGPQMFKGVAAGGAVLVLAFSVIAVLVAGLVNVVSELTGGIRLTVIEEEPSSGYRIKRNPTLAEWEARHQPGGAGDQAGGGGVAAASNGHPAPSAASAPADPAGGDRAGRSTDRPGTVQGSPGL